MKLRDVTELIVDSEHKTAPKQDTGYPYIRTPNIGEGRLILDDVQRISKESYKEWTRRAVPQKNDLILAREAPVGNVAIVTDGIKPCLGQRTVLIRPDPQKINPEYLVYLMLGDEIQERFYAVSTGATVPHLNMSDIRGLELPELPSLETQQNIASILSAFDDLIENNTRRIEILEEIAMRIYREWFVHFRFPSAQGRRRSKAIATERYGEQATPADKRPKLVDSGTELGKIPEGWEVKNVIDLYDTSAGGTPSRKKDEYFDGSIPWVKTKELNDSFIQDTEETITKLGLDNSSAKLFPKKSVLVAMYGATVGQLGVLDIDATTNQACCAIMQKEEEPFDYSYIFLTLLEHRDKLIGLSQGAAQQNINQEIIKEFKILAPEDNLVQQFQKKIYPTLDQIRVLKNQNIKLKETRDLLLPKLISGKIEV